MSLLFDATQGRAEPLTGPRVSLMGVATQTTDERHARRYLARFPAAEMYAGFKDFSFWRVAPGRAHQVAGFGKIQWFENFAIDAAQVLIDAEPGIVAHMNDDHEDAIQLYAKLAGESGEGWVMTGDRSRGCGYPPARNRYCRAGQIRHARDRRANGARRTDPPG